MDYLNDAFGEFHPESDKDAALKFSLCILALDNRTEELLRLIERGNNFGGVEGDPGWIIERREDNEIIGYEGWPHDARFRAFVDPNTYSLSFPEFYTDRPTFFKYVKALVQAYRQQNPKQVEVIRRIEEVLEQEV